MTTPDLVTITCAGCGKTGQAHRGSVPADATFAMCPDCEADPERLAAAQARGERVGEGDVHDEQPTNDECGAGLHNGQGVIARCSMPPGHGGYHVDEEAGTAWPAQHLERAEQVLPPSPERAPRGEPVEPLDLVDADGDRIRFAVWTGRTDAGSPVEVNLGAAGGTDWYLASALTVEQLAQIVRWALRVPGVWPSGDDVGRPYTDEELARGPLTDQAKRFITGNLEGDRG
jgi:hypothetical protein